MAPTPATLKDCPVRQGAGGVQGVDELPLYPRNGWQGGAPFSAESGLETEQLRWLGRGQGKKMKKKEMKNQWLKYSVSRGVGWGVPRPSPGGILSIWRGQHKEAGIWQMASVWGAGEGWQ